MVHELMPPQRLALIPQRVPWLQSRIPAISVGAGSTVTAGEEPSFLLVYH
jgi:hypothetical protein